MGIKVSSRIWSRITFGRASRYFAFGLLFFVATSLVPCQAQTTSGAFLGRITDQAGKVVVGASVQLRSDTTGITTSQVTDNAGEYAFNSVSPGLYQISITAPGFATRVISHINLDVQQTIREDIALSIGSASSTITVTATTPLIQTDTSDVSDVVTGQFIEQTPLDG